MPRTLRRAPVGSAIPGRGWRGHFKNVIYKIFARNWRAFNFVFTECRKGSDRRRRGGGKEKERTEESRLHCARERERTIDKEATTAREAKKPKGAMKQASKQANVARQVASTLQRIS